MNEALLLAMTAASGGGGGGGSSDFSTCQLTFINNSEDEYTLDVAHVYGDASRTTIFNGGFGTEEAATVILYKGEAFASFMENNMPPDSAITVSGGVIFDSDSDFFTITGDGTITIED